jgi:hypothetical protein
LGRRKPRHVCTFASTFSFFAGDVMIAVIGNGRRGAFSGRGQRRRPMGRFGMRLIIAATAAALLTVLAVPAYSQQAGGISKGGGMQAPPKKDKEEKTPDQKKAEDKAYKDAVGRIPDQKFDPWRSVR